DLLRRAVEEDRFQHIRFSEVPRQVLFLQQDRAPTGGGDDPGNPDFHRLGTGCGAKREDGENSQQPFLQDTHYVFLFTQNDFETSQRAARNGKRFVAFGDEARSERHAACEQLFHHVSKKSAYAFKKLHARSLIHFDDTTSTGKIAARSELRSDSQGYQKT